PAPINAGLPPPLPIKVSFRDNPIGMKSLVDISLLRLRVGGLRWLLPILLGAAVPLHGQEDLARQAADLMQAGRFHDAEILWRQLETRSPNDSAIHSNLGVTLAQQGQF